MKPSAILERLRALYQKSFSKSVLKIDGGHIRMRVKPGERHRISSGPEIPLRIKNTEITPQKGKITLGLARPERGGKIDLNLVAPEKTKMHVSVGPRGKKLHIRKR